MSIVGDTSGPGRSHAVGRALAQAHRESDPEILHIFLARDPAEREVRLIEVTRESPTTMEVLPVKFRATADVPLASAVLLLSPAEWAAVLRGELQLPPGWENYEEL